MAIINSKFSFMSYNTELNEGEIILKGKKRALNDTELNKLDDFRKFLNDKHGIEDMIFAYFEDGT